MSEEVSKKVRLKAPVPKAGTSKSASRPAAKGKAVARPNANGPTMKRGLRAPQIRALNAMSTSKEPLNRAEIGQLAPVGPGVLSYVIGSNKEEIRSKNDDEQYPSLITLGYIKSKSKTVDGKEVDGYVITPEGRAALKAAQKDRATDTE